MEDRTLGSGVTRRSSGAGRGALVGDSADVAEVGGVGLDEDVTDLAVRDREHEGGDDAAIAHREERGPPVQLALAQVEEATAFGRRGEKRRDASDTRKRTGKVAHAAKPNSVGASVRDHDSVLRE